MTTPHVFLVTLEFTYAPFSGNGILARSLVKSLLDSDCSVTVWCCRPDHSQNILHHHHLRPPEITSDSAARLNIFSLSVSTWQRLDRHSAWLEFDWARLVQQETDQPVQKTLQACTHFVAIDWTGVHAYRTIPETIVRHCPLVYMNFRVFSLGMSDTEQQAWYNSKEQQALQQATTVIALSNHDRQSLAKLLCMKKEIHVLLPPLRGDIYKLATTSSPEVPIRSHLPEQLLGRMQPAAVQEERIFLTCVVRLSPEKDPLRFVTFLHSIRDLLETHPFWVPVLCGSSSDPTYARQVRDEMFRVAPQSVVVDSFLSPEALCALFRYTLVNVHPCQYDAYGMTIVEAAAMGAPSIVSHGWTVGAMSLLQEDGCIPVEMIGTDQFSNEARSAIRGILQDSIQLHTIGNRAKQRALFWNEKAYGRRLLEIVQEDTFKKKYC